MRWIREFYQNDPKERNTYNFYHSQRRANAILEEVKQLKKGYYLVEVVAIESDEEFRIMGHAGGCNFQYHIGETFTLRQHKNHKNHPAWCDCSESYWYDPRFINKDFAERFILCQGSM